ncbi:insulinase family protein [Flammeovirgaceae bacterium SG7u.111]|nr:insulinase family protein [Flammeovirgaceae bacterium SG7u.132]WPO37203.1 insulinase family protein [Flammeovirgaceae bacterium SG7u.111]
MEGTKSAYQHRIANASDFTFVFVGDFEEEKLLDLVKKYLGNIPADITEKVADHQMRPKKGIAKVHVSEEMETPQTTVSVYFNGKIPYSKESNIEAYMVGELLNKRYMERIREEESYGVSVGGDVASVPVGNYSVSVDFDCNPDKAGELLKIVYAELEETRKGGRFI